MASLDAFADNLKTVKHDIIILQFLSLNISKSGFRKFQLSYNFDKHHYKDFHRAQCTEPTPLALNNFQRFSSNSMKKFSGN